MVVRIERHPQAGAGLNGVFSSRHRRRRRERKAVNGKVDAPLLEIAGWRLAVVADYALVIGNVNRCPRHRRISQSKTVDDFQVRQVIKLNTHGLADHQRILRNHSPLHIVIRFPCLHQDFGELPVFGEGRGDALDGCLTPQVVGYGGQRRHPGRGQQPTGVFIIDFDMQLPDAFAYSVPLE